MPKPELFEQGGLGLEVGGCVDAPVVPPIIRGRANLVGADSPLAPETVAPPREGFPLLVQPAKDSPRRDPKAWAAPVRHLFDERLEEVGAVLLRGFPLVTAADFSAFHCALGYEPVAYDGYANRDEIEPGIFTNNTLPHDTTIMMHSDMMATKETAGKLFFFCESPPPEDAGGETPIARTRHWKAALDPEIIARFAERGVQRRRNRPSLDVEPDSKRAWQKHYGTDDRSEVEAIVAKAGDGTVWEADGSHTILQHQCAIREHLGETLFFSSPYATRPATPADYRYGDGEPIEPEIIELLRAEQWRSAVAFSWRSGDLLCLENIGCQHARLPFTKDIDRRIVLALSCPLPGNFREAGADLRYRPTR